MFKIFKPNKRRYQSKQTPSSMPHRTCYFDFGQLSKSKSKNVLQKTQRFQPTSSQSSRLMHSTSNSTDKNRIINSQNIYSILKKSIQDKAKIYSSQKSLRKKQSISRRDFLQSSKSKSNLIDPKKSQFLNLNQISYGSNSTIRQCNKNDKIAFKQKDQNTSLKNKKSTFGNLKKSIKMLNPHTNKINDFCEQKSYDQIREDQSNCSSRGNSQFCTIIICLQKNQQQKQISARYKVKKIGSLLQFLKNYVKQYETKFQSGQDQEISQERQIVSFQTIDYNLQLDYYLTLQQEDGSFLNGQHIAVKPLYSIKQSLITLNSFDIIQCIGSGGFSNVFLCRFKQNRKFYAMKVISKPFIVKNQKKKIIMNERNIMVELRDKVNLAKLYFAFEAKQYIIFVMQYYEGGELFNLVKKYRKMEQQTARFYITQILIGLQQIHSHNIVYRDFKPQNIMIDLEGHACIADFGLAKPNISTTDDRAYSFCGSPQYMPPQMILKEGHSLPVDFYCLGALLYQLVTGLPPFYSNEPQNIYEATLSQQLTFPEHVNLSGQLEDLILSLLCKDQSYRLGSKFGTQQVLSHPWFRSVNKQDFINRKVKPPVNFKKISDLRFNIDQMKQQNQKQMKQVLKNQKIQPNSKYLKIMNCFYYDYRIYEPQSSKSIQKSSQLKGFIKKKNRLSIQKTKNNSSSLALTNCTRISQNSLLQGHNSSDRKFRRNNIEQKQSSSKDRNDLFHNSQSNFFNQSNSKRYTKSKEKRFFKNMNGFLIQ